MNSIPPSPIAQFDEVVSLAKRRSFFYPSSEIYGGLANTWDFGHYGVLLKNNLRDLWWNFFVTQRQDMVGIEASIFLNPRAWEASGHVAGFTDALIDCKRCKHRTRADHLIEDALPNEKVEGLAIETLTSLIHKHRIPCPRCGASDWTDVRLFNLLFPTTVGIVEESKSKVYLRGEIAQGIFLNFKQIRDTMRVKLPFGIAQQGKAFRNEITMGQSIFRTLEFDLMEFEYFIRKEEWKTYFEMWQQKLIEFSRLIGLNGAHIRWREHEDHERSHYSTRTVDLEYQFPYGWKEMWAIAYRTDYDLSTHQSHTNVDLTYRDPVTGERFLPHVLEPTFGLSRLVLIVMMDAFQTQEVKGKERIFLALHPRIAPVKAAVFALQKDEKLRSYARSLYHRLLKSYTVEFDDSGNIGKMYRRQDEIGTPFCITIDYQTLEDNTVTIRHRDTMQQERISTEEVGARIAQSLSWDDIKG